MDIGKTRFLSEKQFPFLIDNYEVWVDCQHCMWIIKISVKDELLLVVAYYSVQVGWLDNCG